MSTTPREPLLSDDAISEAFTFGPSIRDAMHGYLSGANMVRDIYEVARAKDAELIQQLVDALKGLVFLELCNEEGLSSGAPTAKDWKKAFDKAQKQIDAAAAAGFKPSNHKNNKHMNTTKHTPGPWQIVSTVAHPFAIIADGKQVAVAQSAGNTIPGPERAANARLIAAAPDLLAALQAWHYAYSECTGTEEERRDAQIKAGDMTRAAIAKAING